MFGAFLYTMELAIESHMKTFTIFDWLLTP